ncbi:MAG: hypothetical protein AB2L14_36435 [Candidatus Xenobiia bacterium LiM19]
MHCQIVPEYFNNRKDNDIVRPLIAAVSQEDRESVRRLLRELRTRAATDPVALFDYMFFSAFFYNNVLEKDVCGDYSSRDYTPDDAASVEDLLRLFDKHDDDSRYAGIYDRFHYLESWKDLIWSYLLYVEYNDLYDRSLDLMPESDIIISHSDSALWFYSIIAGRDRRLIELMKRHDSIILEMVPLHPDPKELGDIGIFDGTRQAVERILLNLSFPGKFGYFLQRYQIQPVCSGKSASDADDRRPEVFPLQRLLSEFPRYEHIVRIDYALWQYYIKGGEGDSRKLIDDLTPFYEILDSGLLLENHEEHKWDINTEVLKAYLRAYIDEGDCSEAEMILKRYADMAWLEGEDWLKFHKVLIRSCHNMETCNKTALSTAV